MFTRLYCQHCDHYYEVDLKEARLVEKYHNDKITFENNTHYYTNDECFFTLVRRLRKQNDHTPS